MAVTKNTTWYVNFGNGSSTGYYNVPAWANGVVTAVGALIRQLTTPAVGNERVFVCVVAGTTGGSEPATWTVTKGGKTTDNTVTWMEATGLPALNADNTNTPLSSQNRSGAQVLGDLIQNNTQDHYFICTTAGTTGSGEPSYNTTTGATTTDSGCTWTCLGAVTSFTAKWAAPHNRIANAVVTNWAVAGDTIYVSSIHAETQSTALTISAGNILAPPTRLICVGNAGNIPPQSTDVTTGATVTTTGNSSLTLNSNIDIWGISFSSSTGSVASALTIGSGSNTNMRLHNGALLNPSTLVGTVALSSSSGYVELDNTGITFSGGATSGIQLNGGEIKWRDSALTITGSVPTTLFQGSSAHGVLLVEDVDISAATGTNLVSNGASGRVVMSRCKMPSSYTGQGTANPCPGFPTIDLINCNNGGATYRHERWAPVGTQQIDIIAVLTGGASDGTTAYSWKLSGFNGYWAAPFESMPIAVWNSVTATNRTVTLQGAYNGTALPNNNDLWIEVDYLGTASSTDGTRATTGIANPLSSPSALTASTMAWDSAATARANSTAYVIGNFIKLASNPGRLFICTANGTSAGSEPAGYATAVDGGSVTDGGATFRALVRFSIAVTLSTPQPQEAGYIVTYIKGVKLSSTFWVDPTATLS